MFVAFNCNLFSIPQNGHGKERKQIFSGGSWHSQQFLSYTFLALSSYQ